MAAHELKHGEAGSAPEPGLMGKEPGRDKALQAWTPFPPEPFLLEGTQESQRHEKPNEIK